jgi:hypothetical protein
MYMEHNKSVNTFNEPTSNAGFKIRIRISAKKNCKGKWHAKLAGYCTLRTRAGNIPIRLLWRNFASNSEIPKRCFI